MAIDPNAVGKGLAGKRTSWTSRDGMLYALGVGAGTAELAFTTENTKGVEQRMLPTYAVVMGQALSLDAWSIIGEIDIAQLLHGRQAVELHAPIPVSGSADVSGWIADIQDKGEGRHAVIETVSESVDVETGTKLATCRSTFVVRGAGGFGGERGASLPKVERPDRAPDHEVEEVTREDQALLYRLSGDRNPLHSDPSFAARGGFDRPILHGLCTYGFAGRALLSVCCGGDPSAFGAVDGRFTAPMFPGEPLCTQIWETAEGAFFRTLAGDDRRVVIDDGTFRRSA